MVACANAYEARVIRDIELWRTSPPSFVARALNLASTPLASAVNRVLPESIVNAAVFSTYDASRWLADPAPVLRAAGVSDLRSLRGESLELSDELSNQTSSKALLAALLGGAITGTAGLLTAPLEVTGLMFLAMHSIHRTAQCYGYPLNRPRDRGYVLAILTLAGTPSARCRNELFESIGICRNWLLARTIESVALEIISRQLLRIVCLESVPGLGGILGALANVAFMRQVLMDCRRVFQKRWLRENGILRN